MEKSRAAAKTPLFMDKETICELKHQNEILSKKVDIYAARIDFLENAMVELRQRAGLDPVTVPYEVGEEVEGKGVFFGTWEVFDPRFRKPGRLFFVFVSPEDLPEGKDSSATWSDAADALTSRRFWYGFPGVGYKNECDLRDDLINGNYKGEWFMPPREFLDGRDANGERVRDTSLFDLKDTGAFAGTFNCEMWGSCYWSCTECPKDWTDVYNVCFFSENVFANNRRLSKRRTRAFRAEPVFS
ncbi:MAG: hypothetical protein PHE27_01875 [Alphaproteobacteria bacterium]|nr:hypothetical protein [Alphaproteobacteria bacterium]